MRFVDKVSLYPEFVAMFQREVTLILDKLEFPYETV